MALALLSLVSVLRSREAAREREAASQEAKRSEAVVDMVVDLFGGLDPISGADLDSVRVSDLIAQGAAKAAKLDDQPDVQARLRHVLGRIQLERSAWVPAKELLKAARDAEVTRLPPDDLGAVAVELDYARALHSTGERAAALAARGKSPRDSLLPHLAGLDPTPAWRGGGVERAIRRVARHRPRRARRDPPAHSRPAQQPGVDAVGSGRANG